MITPPLILAIDTSCDDTSAAVVWGQVVLSNVVASQTQLHKQYGGVFPTVAKQAHRENIEPVIQLALSRAEVTTAELSAIAVTQGPGLAPALEVGIEHAKNLASQLSIPLIPVNHIEGHVLSVLAVPKKVGASKEQLRQQAVEVNRKIEELELPVLSIIVSGGHTEFVLVKKPGEYQRLGFTVDDAAGEALDKVGRMLDLGYPAGPVIEQFAKLGDATMYSFPLPMTTSGNANLSFSGMKTAARNLLETERLKKELSAQQVYDFCASFQKAVFKAITYKLSKILLITPCFGVWLGGGVAANMALRATLRQTIKPHQLKLQVPYTKKMCADNAAMIGVVASFKFQRGEEVSKFQTIERIPRWELD